MKKTATVPMHDPQSGFTLLEVVIAVAIFSLLGLATYQLFSSVLNTQTAVFERSEKVIALQRATFMLQRDIGNMVARSVRDELGGNEDTWSCDEFEQTFVFTHHAWDNPLNEERSELQRVQYRMVPDEEAEEQGNDDLFILERDYWRVLDKAPEPKLYEQKLLAGIKSLKWRFLERKEKTSGSSGTNTNIDDDWKECKDYAPSPNQGSANNRALPQAIEVTFEHTLFGELRVLIEVAVGKV
ncbi:type II secretion system minor pseudopilin GspJ [Endozoicomonas sp. SM1973]|uniref:Type II secretion system protein J n=1 Tax=Spartinivicinus marinus TaxID=2994442 RepID=A0A853I6B6_9GAMM|nr:type II secretion system minor pseudopilin GspJ [Spartinivicinus marinus]MCX4029991.1 type II secretion system minor pseudopilin GspJ [Spartinivicinus marinus]NYZ64765.1 type II secretion system minor pseudopilin GspJ [Spartinivicinus marinus]